MIGLLMKTITKVNTELKYNLLKSVKMIIILKFAPRCAMQDSHISLI